jgi:hypothetical protein
MTRRAAMAAAAIAMVLAVPAAAGPPDIFENQYEGRVERTPTTYFGFDVVRQAGAKKVAKVTALVRYHCVNGSGGQAVGRVNGKLRVEDDRFHGTLRGQPLLARAPQRRLGPPSTSRIQYRLAGRLLRRGKAKGTIDATLKFTPTLRGDGQVRCYTGKLDWKAKRGADVVPPKP